MSEIRTLHDIKIEKEILLRQTGQLVLDALAEPYSKQEQRTWFKQEKEARDYLKDQTVATPMLTAISTARGITVEDLVSKVMENVNLFEVASGQIIGKQQRLLDELSVAQTEEEIDNITWEEL